MEIDTSYMEKFGNYGSALPFQICILKYDVIERGKKWHSLILWGLTVPLQCFNRS